MLKKIMAILALFTVCFGILIPQSADARSNRSIHRQYRWEQSRSHVRNWHSRAEASVDREIARIESEHENARLSDQYQYEQYRAEMIRQQQLEDAQWHQEQVRRANDAENARLSAQYRREMGLE